jgi:CubicO group peptidase (beta-lactamase class C family)
MSGIMERHFSRRQWLGAAAACLTCTLSGKAWGDDKAKLTDLIREAHAKQGLAALLCGVWNKDETILTDARGESMTGVPATTDMHLRVGGVAYTCVGMVLLRLAEKRRLTLDDPLSRWYPKLPQAAAVTLRMLANCTSGYSDYVRSPAFIAEVLKNPFRQWRPQELIDFGLAKAPQYKPGTDWNYSHTNFVLLGEILQQVGGKSIHALLDQEICKPLGLTQTESPATAELRSPALHAFSTERGIYEDCTFWSPSWAYPAQMTSTLQDLGTLARALSTDRLLSKKACAEQIAPTTVGLGRWQKKNYYGLGVILLNGWLVQNPQIGGYNLIFAHLPSRRLSVVIAATMGPKSAPDVHYSTLLFKDVVKVLAPEALVPEAFR